MSLVTPDVGAQAQPNREADLTAKVAGDLALAKIDLFTNDITPGPTLVLADYTLPAFTGYAQKAVAGWGGVEHNADGSVRVTATTVLSWAGPGDATGQTIYGYLVRAAAGGGLIAAYRFAAPFTLVDPTTILDLVPVFTDS